MGGSEAHRRATAEIAAKASGSEGLRGRIEARAHALWQAAGRPRDRDLEFWLKAEEEVSSLSVAGEEDPLAALDHHAPGTG